MSEAPLAMIIEDDPNASEIASGMLQMLGFRVKQCLNAHQALYSLAESTPDLILLDICLPEMDGVNLLKIARRVAGAREVPVIAASAVYPKGGPVERSLRELGVKVFMSKPFTLRSLQSALDQVMPRHRSATKAPVPLSMTGRIDGEAKVAGKAVQLTVTGGDGSALKVKTTATPLPTGSMTITLVRREVLDDQISDTEILLLAAVTETESAEGGWTSSMTVTAARPQDAYDRLVTALEGQ